MARRKVSLADPAAIEMCKGFFGHAWEAMAPPPDAPIPRRGYATLHMSCTRGCGAVKVYNVLRSDPGSAKPRYYHAEGYSDVHQSRADWKSQFIAGWNGAHS